MSIANETPQPPEQKAVKIGRFQSENLLSALVALLSILTAVVAFHASQLNSQASEDETLAMQQLIDSNSLYLSTFQDVIYDYQLYDQWVFEEDEEKANYFFDTFTPELRASIERSDGAIDEEYNEEMYRESNALYESSNTLFGTAEALGQRADNLQLVLMLFALGLAFAGWASLLDTTKTTRSTFALFALVMLVVGLVFYGYLVWFG